MSEPAWVPIGAAPAAGVPAGSLVPFAGTAVPPPGGWLLCDGAAVSRTTFAALFAAIGTTYGVGDGSTTFNLPDLRGRVAVGFGPSAAVAAIGQNDGVAAANRRPQHRHAPHAHTVAGGANAGTITFDASRYGTVTVTVPTSAVDGGSGNPADALDAPAYLVVAYIIKT